MRLCIVRVGCAAGLERSGEARVALVTGRQVFTEMGGWFRASF